MTDLHKDLVKRNNGLYYKKFSIFPFSGFSKIPFSGKVTGLNEGSIKNGKKEGAWISYWTNGQLRYKGVFKNGKEEGKWIRYYDSGQLSFKGNYKNGKDEGACVSYFSDGDVHVGGTGTFKNGYKIRKD